MLKVDQSDLDALADANTLHRFAAVVAGQAGCEAPALILSRASRLGDRAKAGMLRALLGVERARFSDDTAASDAREAAHAAFIAVPGLRGHGDACLDSEGEWSGTPIGDTAWTCDQCGETILAEGSPA